MPRPSNTALRRREIADALRTVMAAKGYDGASIGDIAARAGIAPGLVHYHFESKLEILLVLVEALFERHRRSLEAELVRADGDALRQLAVFIDLHLATGRHADPEALACWIGILGEALREPAVRTAHDRATEALVDRLEAILRRGVEQGVIRCRDPRAASAALMAMILGYFVLAATARSKIPPGSAAPAARAMARGLLSIDRKLPPRARRRREAS